MYSAILSSPASLLRFLLFYVCHWVRVLNTSVCASCWLLAVHAAEEFIVSKNVAGILKTGALSAVRLTLLLN
jgi:hypothetical protein